METSGCIRSAQRSSRTRTPANISRGSSALRIGTTIFCPRRQVPFLASSLAQTVHSNSMAQSLELKLYKPAHTDGDLSVTFAEADILHVADTYWNGIYPFIDYSTGGSIDGMIAA